MQENTTIARPYAQAVFEQAQADGSLQKWSAMLNLLNLVGSDRNMVAVLKNPKVNHDQRISIILDICGNELDEKGRNFVRVLIDAGRFPVISEICKLFEEKKAEADGIEKVEVVSAYPLENEQQDKISQVMAKRLNKKIEITTRIDESLIGGAIIRAGDSVIDASLRGRLRQLGHRFAE